ncbi:MAG TPA: S1 RNA-binding domain-containing protein, partial [Tepidisphaeraceae bacterium]|nr:S1 RNA-binding domain-containing protein [Tepidisphaeraceae bacterium]
DDGTVYISSTDGAGAEKCRDIIEAMTAEVKVGKIYTGRVVSIKDFGAFVEIAPETDGLCHVSELSDRYVERVTDFVNMGDEVKVKVILIDDQGRIKLSRKAAMKELGETDPEPANVPAGEGEGDEGGEGHRDDRGGDRGPRRDGGGHRGGGHRGGPGGGGQGGGGRGDRGRGGDRGPRRDDRGPRRDD